MQGDYNQGNIYVVWGGYTHLPPNFRLEIPSPGAYLRGYMVGLPLLYELREYMLTALHYIRQKLQNKYTESSYVVGFTNHDG